MPARRWGVRRRPAGGGNLVVAARSVRVFDDLQSSLMRLPIAAFRS
ncbi:MAG: hypothetical protein ACJ765_03570 [Chloroflexota bacterium]